MGSSQIYCTGVGSSRIEVERGAHELVRGALGMENGEGNG